MSNNQIAAFAVVLFVALAALTRWFRVRQRRARLNRGLQSYVAGCREEAPEEELAAI